MATTVIFTFARGFTITSVFPLKALLLGEGNEVISVGSPLSVATISAGLSTLNSIKLFALRTGFPLVSFTWRLIKASYRFLNSLRCF